MPENHPPTGGRPSDPSGLTRRSVVAGLGGTLAAGLGLAACAGPGTSTDPAGAQSAGPAPGAGSAATSGSSTSAPPSAGGAAPSTATPAPAPAVLTQAGPDIIAGSRTSNTVALTFHAAGDPALAAQAMDLIDKAGVRVSVFCVGTWIGPNADLVRRLRDGGHDIGNHTWSHQTMPGLNAATDDTEIGRAADALGSILGAPGVLFRPSGTRFSTPTIRAAAARHGYARSISYDTDSLDYTDPTPDAVVKATTAGLKSGAIVSMHFGHAATLAALPRIFAAMADRGLAGRTVTELFALPGALTTQ